MKRIILSVLALVAAGMATAQEEYSRWSVTPKAGLTVATVVGDDTQENSSSMAWAAGLEASPFQLVFQQLAVAFRRGAFHLFTFAALLDVIVEVAVMGVHHALIEFKNLIAHSVKEITVMCDHEQRHAEAQGGAAAIKEKAKVVLSVAMSSQPTEQAEQAVAGRTGQQLCMTVEDTGIGIPEEEAEHIFDEFVQLDEYYDGTGIGLTVARSIARRLGGDIVLDTSYKEGARFVYSLPL